MTKTILAVEGMSCSSCVEQVGDALSIDGVVAVDVQLESGLVSVDHRPSVSAGRLVAALQQIGYEARPRSSAVPESPKPAAASCCGGRPRGCCSP